MRKFIVVATMLCMCLSGISVVRAEVNVIPKPENMEETGNGPRISSLTSIGVNDDVLLPAGQYLQEMLARYQGKDVKLKKGKGRITLRLCDPDSTDEHYILVSDAKGVRVEAHSYRGIINGIATLRQLLPASLENGVLEKGSRQTLPGVRISDGPVFHWRGLMLDPVRHFYSVEETKRLLDHMALYKMNKFHWHLIDDQACRIEVKQYPRMTREGAYHPFNALDKACIARGEKEKNPTFFIPEKYIREKDGEKLYGGFYTQEEIKDVIAYAAVRGIDVVPEIDMPGHSTVACQCYPQFSCGNQGASPLCLGKDETIEYAKRFFNEVFELFPYEYVSIGGDEVDRTRWNQCPDCQKRIADEHLANAEELQAWFTKGMEKYFNAHGRRLLGWDEILEGGLSKTATVHWWRGDHPDVTQRATAMGNEVVLCPFTFCYFDYPQDNNTLRRIYDGHIVPTDLTSEQLKLIKGMQANIWCEYIPTEARMQFMVFPRALALAEKAWTPDSRQNWDDFKLRLTAHLERLHALGINYRPLETDIP